LIYSPADAKSIEKIERISKAILVGIIKGIIASSLEIEN